MFERLKLVLPYCVHLFSMLIHFIERSTAKEKVETTDIWYSWQSCQTISGSRDQNCRGTQRQTGKTVEVKSGDFVRSLSRTRNCYLTNGK